MLSGHQEWCPAVGRGKLGMRTLLAWSKPKTPSGENKVAAQWEDGGTTGADAAL